MFCFRGHVDPWDQPDPLESLADGYMFEQTFHKLLQVHLYACIHISELKVAYIPRCSCSTILCSIVNAAKCQLFIAGSFWSRWRQRNARTDWAEGSFNPQSANIDLSKSHFTKSRLKTRTLAFVQDFPFSACFTGRQRL